MLVLYAGEPSGRSSHQCNTSNTGTATVCGIGAVTGYGWGRKYLWEGVTSGVPSGRLTPGFGGAFDADEVWVSPVPDGGDVMDGRGRFGRAVHAAVREALEDATDRGWRPGEVVGMVHAIVLGEVELWRDFYLVHGMRRTRKQFIELMPSTPLTTIMREHDFHGPCMGVTAMCASGNAGLLTAKQWIDSGMATDVIVVATDISATPENVKPFVDLGVCVADRAPLDGCRPFQEGSGGFIVGEASVAMVMSSSPNGGYARVLGGAMTQDAHHVISIEPSYAQLRRCWTTGLANAGVHPARHRLPQRARARDTPVRHRGGGVVRRVVARCGRHLFLQAARPGTARARRPRSRWR